jgi:hypothetical protein
VSRRDDPQRWAVREASRAVAAAFVVYICATLGTVPFAVALGAVLAYGGFVGVRALLRWRRVESTEPAPFWADRLDP